MSEETYAAAIDQAMHAKTQDDADLVFGFLVQYQIEEFLVSRELAEVRVRNQIGYNTGYHSHEVRRRVEALFKCEHPYFGSIANNGPPTLEQAFSLGLALGRQCREEEDDA